MGRGVGRVATGVLLLAACLTFGQLDEPRLIGIARASVESAVLGQPPRRIEGATPAKPTFVTIEVKGKVVGCRGFLVSKSRTLEEAIADSARSAAAHDPRYPPLTKSHLADYLVTVTIVDRLEPLTSVESLTPADGLVLRSGNRVGVVLPWEGKDPKVRLQWAYRKAGVPPGSAARLERMVAIRFRG